MLALIGLAMSLYPPIMMIGWLTLFVALVLGVLALFAKGPKRGLAIAGVATSVVGFGVAALAALVYGGALLWGLYLFSTEASVSTTAPQSRIG